MSELLQRSMDYARGLNVEPVMLVGAASPVIVWGLLDRAAWLVLTTGDLVSPLLGEIVYDACAAIEEARSMRIIVRAPLGADAV